MEPDPSHGVDLVLADILTTNEDPEEIFKLLTLLGNYFSTDNFHFRIMFLFFCSNFERFLLFR